jgi:hypothetical protein
MKLPYIKWYYRDASADLRIIDAEPRCVWYEMLWLMASSDRYGYLERQGRPMTDEEIGRLSGLPIKVIEAARPILLADSIPSIEPETGIWYCRRMVADAHKRDRCAEAGKRGGGSPLLASSPLATDAVSEPRTQNPYKGKGTPKRSPIKVEDKAEDQPAFPFAGDSEAEQALETWLSHKRERHESYKPTGLKGLYKSISAMGRDRFIAAVAFSTSCNYAGLVDRAVPSDSFRAPRRASQAVTTSGPGSTLEGVLRIVEG